MALPTATSSNGIDLGSILQSLPGLATMFGGSTSTTTGGISQDGMNAMLSQLLSSNQGLASVASGQNTSGMYNSTVQTQMVNDLMTRAAGQVAAQNTSKTTVTNPTVSPVLSGGAAALGLGAKLYNAAGGVSGIKKLLGIGGDTTSGADAYGLGGSPFTSGATSTPTVGATLMGPTDTISNAVATPMANAAVSPSNAGGVSAGTNNAGGIDVSSSVLPSSASSAASISSAIPTATDAGMSAAGSTLSGVGGSVAGDVASNAATDAAAAGVGGNAFGFLGDSSSVLGDAGSAAASSVAGDALPYLGSVIDATQGNWGGAAGSAVGAVAGSYVLPGIGTAIGSFLGQTIGSACFITTAVCKGKNRPDDCEELELLRGFRDSYMQRSIKLKQEVAEYYVMAPKIVEFIEALPAGVSKFILDRFDNYYIQPAIEAIKLGNNEVAYSIYCDLYQTALEIMNGR